MAETENYLQRLLYEFNKAAKQNNMSISTENQDNVLAKEPMRCKLVVEDKPIEIMMEVEYLGIKI